MIVWAFLWIGAFSLAGTKLPSYILPAYPAGTLIGGVRGSLAPRTCLRAAVANDYGLVCVDCGRSRHDDRAAARGSAISSWRGSDCSRWTDSNLWRYCRGHFAPASSICAHVGGRLCDGRAFVRGGACFGAARVSRHTNSASLIELARQDGRQGVRIGTYAHPESSVVYYARSRVERCELPAEAADFLERTSGGYLITNAERWAELQPMLPSNVTVIARQPRFLKHDEVLLVGRRTQTAAVPREPRR